MIDVIYREDVSEDSIHEPRNVKQTGSVDPRYRIYMEDAVLTYIRKISASGNGVQFGLLLGELKRAAGTTYLFIRGMVRAVGIKNTPAGRSTGWKKDAEAGKPTGWKKDAEAGKMTGSGAVALERLTMDRQRGTEGEEGHGTPDRQRETEGEEGHGMPGIQRGTEGEEGHDTPGRQSGTEDEKADPMPEKQREMAGEDDEAKGKKAEFDGEREAESTADPLIEFDGETWTRLYEDINRWFPDMEILGWYASFPFLNVAEFDLCREIHYTHFSGADKVLFLCDRTEQEENFYRPDGAELRETEGYFTFFEKNDVMLAYQQENEPQEDFDKVSRTEGRPHSSLRQGTVGEAPRRKWNISAASIVITAALLAAVVIVNQYNSRLKADGTGSSDGVAEEETSSIRALAVNGQVTDSITGSEENGDGDTDSERTGDGDTDSEGAGDGDTDSEGAGDGDTDSEGAGDGDTDGEGTGDGSTDSGEIGSQNGTENGETGTDKIDSDENGASGSSVSDGSTASDNESSEVENVSGNSESGQEEETIQTGSRVSARYYTVKSGETLYSICMDVYKTSAMVEIVRVLNGIGEDYVIQAGQKILLP